VTKSLSKLTTLSTNSHVKSLCLTENINASLKDLGKIYMLAT
jgi:hypothetical protein